MEFVWQWGMHGYTLNPLVEDFMFPCSPLNGHKLRCQVAFFASRWESGATTNCRLGNQWQQAEITKATSWQRLPLQKGVSWQIKPRLQILELIMDHSPIRICCSNCCSMLFLFKRLSSTYRPVSCPKFFCQVLESLGAAPRSFWQSWCPNTVGGMK